MKRLFAGMHPLVAAAGLLWPVCFLAFYSMPAWYGFDHPVMDYVNWLNGYIASHKWHMLAYLLGLEAVLLAIWLYPAFFRRHLRHFRWMLPAAALLVTACYAWARKFDTDEYEHFHSAWNMLQGKIPYIDFFQHHHPLIWYQNMLPLLGWGESFSTLLAGRGFNLVFFAGQLYLTFLLAKATTGFSSIGRIAALLLLAFKYYVDAAIENRPDNPQTFFFLWSLYLLMQYWDRPRKQFLLGSGLLFAVSFLYLQKAVLAFPVYLFVLAFFIRRKKLSFRGALLFWISFAAPVLLFLFPYAISGRFEEYLLYNWVVNLYKQEAHIFWRYSLHILLFNPFFLILLALSLSDWIRRLLTMDDRLKVILIAGLFLGILAVASARPWKQYFLPVWPLLAIGVAYTLDRFLRQFPAHIKLVFPILLLGLSIPVYGLEILVFSGNRNKESLEYVLKNSRPDDYVFDEYIVHNVFRRDMHFFWYSTHNDGLYSSYLKVVEDPRYRWLVKKRHDDFQFCDLVERYIPKFIAVREDSGNHLENCPSKGRAYQEHRDFPQLFVRER